MRTGKPWAPLLLLAVSAAISVQASHFGKLALDTIHGNDWLCHADQAETYFIDARIDPAFSYLSQMRTYPPLAYWITDAFAGLAGVTPIEAMQMLIGLLSVLLCFLFATRLLKQSARAPLAALALVILIYGAETWAGTGITGMLRYNFYYAHFVGVALALLGIELVRRYSKSAWQSAAFTLLFGAGVMPLVHLEPAFWVLGAGFLMTLTQLRSWRQAALWSGAVAAALATVLLFLPSARIMVQIAQQNGGLNPSPAIGLPHVLLLFRALALLSVLGLAAWFAALRKELRSRWRELLWDQAGFFAILLLIVAQFAALRVLGTGSPYAIRKHIYLLAFELPLFLLSIAQRRASEPGRLGFAPQMAVLLIAFLAGAPFFSYPVSQVKLLQYRQRLVSIRDRIRREPKVFPQFADLELEQNVYLAMSALGYHWEDPETMNWWLRKGARSDRPLRLEDYRLAK